MSNIQHPTFCCYCGAKYEPSDLWPKVCKICKKEVWGNPPSVAIALCPMGDEVLLVQRNLREGFGKWALPGGFVNHSEALEKAASRELEEETEKRDQDGDLLHPGLTIPFTAFNHLKNISMPNLNLILVFHWAAWPEHLVRNWWERARKIMRPGERWNKEVQSLRLVSAREVADLEIAFSSHGEVLERWFAR